MELGDAVLFKPCEEVQRCVLAVPGKMIRYFLSNFTVRTQFHLLNLTLLCENN